MVVEGDPTYYSGDGHGEVWETDGASVIKRETGAVDEYVGVIRP